MEKGLDKHSRHHVHLSSNRETALETGKRHGKPSLLKVSAGQMHEEGFEFFISANGVWLTDRMPAAYLKLTER